MVNQKLISIEKRQTKNWLPAIIGIIIVVLIGGGILVWQWREIVKVPELTSTPSPILTPTLGDEDTIRRMVISFGETLKTVDLVAPYARESIKNSYCGVISEKLCSEWMENPELALGRFMSSPWPDRIRIDSIEKTKPEEYQIKGSILWVTSSGIESEDRLILTIIKEEAKTTGIKRWIIGNFIYQERQAKPKDPGIKFLSPKGGEKWQIGKTYRIEWTTPEIEKGKKFTACLLSRGSNLWIYSALETCDIPYEQGYYDWNIEPEDFSMIGLPIMVDITVWEEGGMYPFYTIRSEEFVIIK